MANSVILVPFFIFCFLFPSATTSSSNETDLVSLLAFKSAIDLDPQGALSSWSEAVHFCSWKGIQCGHRHRDRVVEINLRSQGLVGSLSPHVGNLSFLRNIILQNNSFHGPIPQEIGLLRRLEFVEFSNNSFVGAIPKNLSRCPNLVYLNLIDNNLSGNIPAELGSMSKLELLGLGFNKLSGPIPQFIGNMTSLRQLSLLSCGFKGEIPESLAQLQSLTFLQLAENRLSGIIPSAIFNISTMQYFGANTNQLHGVIPSTIGLTLPNLRGLYLWENQFSGPIPASISNASLLEWLELNVNYFTGPIPAFARLADLRGVVLQSNLIADDISFISSLTNSTNLEFLQVGENLLSGSLPDAMANLSTHLSSLLLHMNKIHGKIPSAIGDITSLTTIALYDNYLEGSIPIDIAKISNLHRLHLERNQLTNDIPSSFGNLTLLNSLTLSENNLSGAPPSSLGNCTNLLVLDLSINNFIGLIPLGIIGLSSLSIALDLSDNYFEGSIPYEVSSLTNLGVLDLANNKLSGPVPNSLSHCTSLQILYLDGNLLEGEIPSGLSALMGLQDLGLSRNNLSGPIPSFLAKLNLSYLNLSFNKLQGEVPMEGIFKNKTSFSLEGNKQLCGGILELKLPPCSPVQSQKSKLSTLLKILIPILAVGGIFFVILAYFTYKKRMSQKNVTLSASQFTGPQFMRLSYADLLKATGGFSETNLVGVGRFGSVYKGILDDGQTLMAVKVLNLFVKGATKSFMVECNALRDIRHRNLLKILSVCESIDFQGNDFKALVYEFKANGSLEKWLYDSREQEREKTAATKNLDMIQRLNIAIDIAQAIEYLHFGTGSSIVHGDLKPSNILLDHEMTACVGDFGLVKIISNIIPSYESDSSIGIRGTIGYVPSEYGTTHSISAQGDVYSYGIVLLEMFTNKKPTDDFFTDHVNLPNFVSAALPDRVMEIVDPQFQTGADIKNTDDFFTDHVNLHNFVSAALPDRVMEIVDPQFQTGADIKNNKIKDCMASILTIGVSCSKEMPKDRMSMTDVVNELHKIQKLLCC